MYETIATRSALQNHATRFSRRERRNRVRVSYAPNYLVASTMPPLLLAGMAVLLPTLQPTSGHLVRTRDKQPDSETALSREASVNP